jgi:hypothetical protein
VVTTGGSGATGAVAADAAAEVAGPEVAAAAGAVPAGAGLGSASLPCGAPLGAGADFWLELAGAALSAWPAGVWVEGAPEQPRSARPPVAMIAGSATVAASAMVAASPVIAGRIAPEPAATTTGIEDRDDAPATIRSRAARALLPRKPSFIARSG